MLDPVDNDSIFTTGKKYAKFPTNPKPLIFRSGLFFASPQKRSKASCFQKGKEQAQVGSCTNHIRGDTYMEKGILFIGHSIEPDKRIIVGVQGAGLHASILTIEEAIKAQEHLMRTIEMLKSNKSPEK